MCALKDLFEANARWAENVVKTDPDFFVRLSQQHAPEYLWIGCADSRVPASQITDRDPGEIFVHRNIANVVVHTDLNCLSVMQFAVDHLKVKHIIVCGHYGCAGVTGALDGNELGLVENWLRHIQDVHRKHFDLIEKCSEGNSRSDRLCELNVIEQVINVCRTTIVRDAWRRGQPLTVHGWIYGLDDGKLNDLDVSISALREIDPAHLRAIAAIAQSLAN